MPQVIELFRWDYGPIYPAPAPEWRSASDLRCAVIWAFAALIAVAFLATRYGWH
jgi:hypothetical protein